MAALQGTQGSVRTDAAAAVDQAVGAALERHYRDVLTDSKVDLSSAWSDSKIAIRHFNTFSPVLLALIQRPDPEPSIEQRRERLDYMANAIEALSKVMSGAFGQSVTDAKRYDRIELTSALSHIVARQVAQAPAEQEQNQVKDLLLTVASLYSDPAFEQRHRSTAALMMDKVAYLPATTPETMEARLRTSMHQAALRMYEALSDERVGNGKGDYFTYGLKKVELLGKLTEGFTEVFNVFVSIAEFSPSLTTDQRTTVLQSWIRQGSEIYRAEYVAATARLMTWFKEGLAVSKDEFKSRFDKAKASLPEVIKRTNVNAARTLAELADFAGFDTFPEVPDSDTARPAP